MKLQNQKKEVFFYKEIGKTRNEWLEEHGGIKIYRDNFWVRPYGENGSDSFDWLGLEARNNANPVAVSSKTEAWTVRNAIFLTFLFVFGGMLWRVMQGDVINVDTSSFLTFLVFNVLCLEFGLKKALVDRFFKR